MSKREKSRRKNNGRIFVFTEKSVKDDYNQIKTKLGEHQSLIAAINLDDKVTKRT